MFNLERSIAEWRRRMQAAGIKSPVPLDELESHLRDEIEQQMKAGLVAEQSFVIAAQRVGQAGELKSEFKKRERTGMKKKLMISAGIVAVLFGTALILPAWAWYNNHGAMPAEHLAALLLGIVIAGGGLSVSIYGFKKRKA